jgi:hypothetical protein
MLSYDEGEPFEHGQAKPTCTSSPPRASPYVKALGLILSRQSATPIYSNLSWIIDLLPLSYYDWIKFKSSSLNPSCSCANVNQSHYCTRLVMNLQNFHLDTWPYYDWVNHNDMNDARSDHTPLCFITTCEKSLLPYIICHR